MTKLVILPGDGIGPEIIDASLPILEKVSEKFNLEFSMETADFGGNAYDKHGNPFPDETWEKVQNSNAVILGSVGGPKWDDLPRELRPEAALLGIRKRLGLYCNIRPVKYHDILASKVVWKEEYIKGVDIVIIRELTGGAYFGAKGRDEHKAFDNIEYTAEEVERIVRRGFEIAMNRKKVLHSVDKANVLESSRLWREVTLRVAKEYPEVRLEHLYVDNAALQLVINPKQFDVIVTENMFGDILSDQAAALAGSLGMLPSASLGGEIGVYEPAHGSAPDIAGQDKANPLATILSLAMMLRFTCKNEEAAKAIEVAVEKVMNAGFATIDIAGPNSKLVGTKEMAELVLKEI
ncbi:3-isopropylmalate dehydrogenase [Desulfonispora thiosulfatigenes DSM 11270]|uniref:3-isopropylmalate dehydrogenase n=1 Tax=Desulfonispora thiosulfatigenes DSM 11270 TaxID=656914 RepID=A0A1W1VEA2_DESTI|nr:3-isopropylmalate dehydrogenase [Desulfonispora thiosulfatigenes]SMB91777.1 3-isopropylmalate dehydrogenase [Desulfonispora thiosulfatigenes DSM 11270]